MRTRIILTGALLLVFAGVARAQQEPAAAASQTTAAAMVQASTPLLTPKFGQVDVGFRGNDVSGDAARYMRFQDFRTGGYVSRFKLAKDTEQWAFAATANNVGYRDQRYTAGYESIGKLKLDFDWNQVPLYINGAAQSLYTDTGNGVLAIDDSLQRTLQTAGTGTSPATLAALTKALNATSQADMRSLRKVGQLNMVYTVNRDVDLEFDVRNSARDGSNLMSFGFGTSPGLNPALEFGVPTDDRTTDVKGSVEYANARGLVSLGYNASWYVNHLPTVTFDNPLRADDISGGPSKGLAVMWPTNHSFSYNMNGSYKLPARSRVSAAISIGQWAQNEALVNPTVNTALVAPPLERATADTKADVVSMVYSFNSRPNEFIWLNAKYRYYDYANKTPVFDTVALIADWSLGTAHWENEPSSMKRNTVDLDASVSPHKYMGFNLGYTREASDRTFRIYERTEENTYRVGFDSTANQFVTLRTKYEHSTRTGSGFNEALLEEVGEQAEMRHFDIADRTRDRVTALVMVTPSAYFAVNGSVSTGADTFGNSGFGLRNNDNRTWNLGVDAMPSDKVNLGVTYGQEKYTAMQYSRAANPLSPTDTTFNDPTRDWWMDQSDTVKTLSATADFLKCLPRTNIRLGYDISDGDATYVYTLKPEQRVFTTVPLTQLAPLKNKLTDARMDVQYFLRPNLALGVAYAYEAYTVDDFALGPETLDALAPVNGTSGVFASTIYSGYLYRNYRANTGWVRLTYLW